MSDHDNFPQVERTAVQLGRRYGDAMKSVPLLLKESEIIELQTKPRMRPRDSSLMLSGIVATLVIVTSLIVIQQTDGLGRRGVASSVPPSTRPQDPRVEYRVTASSGLHQPIKAGTDAARGEVKPDFTDGARPASEPHVLASRDTLKAKGQADLAQAVDATKSTNGTNSGQRTNPLRQTTPAIEPYRNGTIAKPLYGEALRLALIEDKRLTREMNKATLRDILAKQQND